MAKKRKDDTSPLAMGRKQQGSLANKRQEKTGSKSVSQSSVSQKERQAQKSYGTTQQPVQKQRVSKPTTQQRQTQKSYGVPAPSASSAREKLEADRKKREEESRARREAAQNQKMGLNSMATADQQRAANRAVRNTPKVVKEAGKQALIGHGKTAADITALNNSSSIGSKIDIKSKEFTEDIEKRRKKSTEASKNAYNELSKKQEESEKRLEKVTKNAKGLEKAYYGAVESGTGMLTDFVVGMGTQAGALTAMGSRTYGSTRGKAQKEGATEDEDRLYSLLQGGKEVGTELMFPGAGLAKKAYGKAGIPLARVGANALTKRLRGKTADVVGAGLRLAGGVGEENIEEVAGWGLDPLIKEATYGKNVRERRKAELLQGVPDLANKEEASGAAAYLSSGFIEDTTKDLMDNGASAEEAQQMAEKLRDFYSAYYSGDEETMDTIAGELSGAEKLSKKSWNLGELGETIASTTLLTGVTGLPGTITTSARGSAIRDELGEDGLRALANYAANFEDKDASVMGEVARDRLNEGGELTSTQVYELAAAQMKQEAKDIERVKVATSAATRKMEQDNLVEPYVVTNGGVPLMGEATGKTYTEESQKAENILKDKESITEQQIDDGSRAIAGFKTGVFTVNDANALNYSNTEIREAFTEATGVDLNQYVVRDNSGNVDIPATNTATKDALFAMASDNLVRSAEAETANWMDNVKGEVVTQVSSRMAGKGSLALQLALDDVDERNRSEYMMTANAADMMYQQGRNMGVDWETISSEAKSMFPNIPETKLQMMYEAGLADRQIANDKAIGLQTTIGEKMSSKGERTVPGGKVLVDTTSEVKGTEIRLFSEIANQLGADIHLVDEIVDSEGNVVERGNGMYDPKANAFYLNVSTGAETNIGYIFMHECTHYLKMNAPQQYQELENLVRERWFSANPEQMQNAIARKIEAYKAVGQNLTEEQALEEIIADAAHEFINDPNFANQVAEENPTLAKALLDSIRNALRMLRRILSSGSIDDETHMNSLFSQLDILDEAEKLWLNAYTQAVQNRADQAIYALQDEINAESRLSLGYHAGDLGKSTVDDYYNQGYGRGTGHFGFGTYFVGNKDRVKNYNKRNGEPAPIEEVDFDKYNLFRPQNASKGYDLHDALKRVDGFIEEYSDLQYDPTTDNDSWDKYYWRTSGINSAYEDVLGDMEWGFDIDEDKKAKVDEYIATMSESDRDKIEKQAEKAYKEAQERSTDEETVRNELRDKYHYLQEWWPDTSSLWANEDDYIEDRISREIESRKEEKKVSLDLWKYRVGQEIVEKNSENYKFRADKVHFLGSDLRMALDFEHSSAEIEDALRETERIVNGYKSGERGLDSAATVFMKLLGYEGVDVRHINDLDNTGYGSVIYNLKDEDLARKQEIGTARFSISEPKSASARYEQGYKLSQKQFRSFYSAHKLNLRGQEDLDKQIADIKENGFRSATALSNVMPVSTNDTIDPDNMNIMQGKYGVRKGETVLLVPKPFVDKDDRIKDGFVPRNYEVVTAERDFQPYYELYSKAYDSVRFSLSEPVERVRDLIAVHNIWPDDLIRSLDMGGFAMPSIAVIRDNMEHDKYGSISLLFGSDTIDPQMSRDNRVWGGDAYTPTFPTIERKFNEGKGYEIERHLLDLFGAEDRRDFNDNFKGLFLPSFDQDNLANKLRYGTTPAEVYERELSLKLAYLMEKDNAPAVPLMTVNMQNEGEEFWNALAGKISKDALDEYMMGDLSPQERMDRFEPTIRETVKEAKADKKFYKDHPKLAARFDEKLGFADVDRYMRDLLRYYNEGGMPQRVDEAELANEISNRINEDEYKEWLNNLFDGIVEAEGIRNEREPYLPSGSRRSWEALHEPVTIQNVVAAMRAELQAGQGIFGGVVKGAAQKEYKSLDDIREDEGRLQKLDDEEYEALMNEAEDKVDTALDAINEHNPTGSSYYIRTKNDIGGYVAEILNKTRKKETIQKKLQKDYDIEATDEMMDDLMEGIKAIAEIPTGYFEAKPARAVPFTEVKAAILPAVDSSVSTELRERLQGNGIKVYDYDSSVEGDRRRAVNEAASEQDIRFSITDSEGADLSEGQVSFFENSKNRDAEGRLKVMLHGTNAEFTEFDPSKAQPGTLGRAFYFSDSASHAGQYGNVGRYYLNLENPLVADTHDITRDQLRRFVAELADNEDYGIENYGADATVDSVTDSVWGGTDFVMLRDLNLSCVGDFAEALKVFNRINGTDYDGIITAIETVAFYPQQIKRTDNLNPTLNKDTRYSITDSESNELSDGQVDYFKDSQARDEQGRLLRVYHGTMTGARITNFSNDSRAYWFSPNYEAAEIYSMGEDYDIPGAMLPEERNPYDTDEEYFAKMGYRFKQNEDGEWTAIRTDDSGREYTYDYSYESKEDLMNSIYENNEAGDLYDSRFGLRNYYSCYLNLVNPMVVECNESSWDDINNTGMSTNDYALEARYNGYDGIIFKNVADPLEPIDVYVAFASDQIKDVRNENPTDNPDIRFSITDDEDSKSRIAYEDAIDDSYEALERYERLIDTENPETYNFNKPFKEEDVTKFYAALKGDEAVVYDDPINEEDRVRIARSKEDFFNSLNAKWQDRWTTGGEVLDVKSVKTDIRNLVIGVMANSDTPAKYRNEIVKKTLFDVRTAFQLMKQDRTDIASYLLYHSAQRMIDNVEFYVDGTFDMYKDLKHYLRTTKISIGEEYWSDVDYDAFRKRNFGRLKLVKGTTNVDQIYQELQGMYPEWFSEDETMSVPDQLLEIEHVLDSVQPYKEAYSSEAAAELAFDIADELYDIMAGGKEVRSLADTYKQRYDEKTKAMKQRHAEAMLRMRKARDIGIQAERAKWQAREERSKERTAHKKYFERITNTYDELKERLLSNTADKNIPEQYKKDLARLLAAFDLQTVGSKNREARTGHVAQKTIKMAAIRSALENIEKRSDLFHVNDAITDIIDELQSIDGQTVDALSANELQNIDKMLRALLHEFNNYQKVKIGAKKQQAQDLADAQVESALEHAKTFGPGNDYYGPKGWLDQIINMDEMTPAYMFKRIDPNNVGLGLMWKEIRRSQDRYIRNNDQLTKWMEEIIGQYHNKGYGADTIEQWRSSNYARTFNFENGSVELTPAQMMSLYCLSKRNQAYGHMIGAGIVVSPVSFQAKIMSDLKKKTNRALPVILTDADIKQVVTALTPDQIQIANKLQELMATKMADWGNEASMNVLGIKLFNESDYFPIKSDKAALEKDLTNEQFENAIRNFGFTKAVQPGARNAIMIDDIFDVVTEHCNNMNLYNSYSETLNDFMKVWNKHSYQENGADYSVAQAISHAYSQKATNFIMTFIRDLNGNVSRGRISGIENAYNDMLANAKKAAVFANVRVLLQQPTAITRAFAVISPKYLKGVHVEKGAMQEMFEHCPIALWKSWGYYDINMGKSIEDVIMNEGNWLNDVATQAYGAADNITWTAIWQMVKAEMKDTHPDVKVGADEYWELCNERMSEIVDLTQVVDSPLHRSHAMRSKDVLHKTATAFMAEPTLTFNMIRDGYERAREAWAKGDKSVAGRIASRTLAVVVLQAATVSAAAAIADALRGKGKDDSDEDDYLSLWWLNFVNNMKDELHIWNKVYYVKDVASLFEGWSNPSLYAQGWSNLATGFRQLNKKLFEGSKTPWWTIYYNIFGGAGYFAGVPVKTLMKDGRALLELFGVELPESLTGEKKSDAVVSKESSLRKILPFKKPDSASAASVSEAESVDDGAVLGTKAAKDSEELQKLDDKAKEKAEGLSDSEKDEVLWDVLSDGYTKRVEDADYEYIDQLKEIYISNGGNAEVFDAKVLAASKKALKKSISYDQTPEENWKQDAIKAYMTGQGMTEAEISDIAYKSEVARDLKVALRLGDEELIKESLQPLVEAGLSREDFDRLWQNRNRMNISNYKVSGRYKDKLKSQGNFVWPTQGTITSHFGYRNAPTAGASSNHPAIDIGAAAGSEVVAADGGTVIYVGWNGGYGNSVGIKHDNGMVTYYNHLSGYNVHEGDVVSQGQQIAQVGSTGISTGPHLDFKILDVNGNPVDPEKYLS